MATPKQNYVQQFRAYAEPSYIPSSVRSYSVFDPNSNSWRRMTNNGRSPMPIQGQTLIPTQTPGIMLRPRVQEQSQIPVQIPSRESVRPSVTLQPRTSIPPRGLKISDATSETLGLDIPVGRVLTQSGPETGTLSLGIPTSIRQIKPATAQAPTPVVAINPNNTKVTYGTPDSLPTTFVEKTYTPPDSTLKTAFNNSLPGLALALYKKGYREAKPYVVNATDSALKYADDATRRASNTLNQWHTGFLNWLNN